MLRGVFGGAVCCLDFQLSRYPEPEGGSDAYFALDAYLAVTLLDDGLTDGEAETSALDKVVELDEALKYRCLLLLGDAGTRVFAIEVETVCQRCSAR